MSSNRPWSFDCSKKHDRALSTECSVFACWVIDELGGKSPQVVFDDAEFGKTFDLVMLGFVPNAGQFCVSGSRLLAQEGIAERLVAA